MVNFHDIASRVPGGSMRERHELEMALYDCVNTTDIRALCSQYGVTISQDEALDLALQLLHMRRSGH